MRGGGAALLPLLCGLGLAAGAGAAGGAAMPGGVPTPDLAPVAPLPLEELRFEGGFPTPETVDGAYRTVDLARAVTAYLDFTPAASAAALAGALPAAGVAITETLMHADPLFLTANTETVYAIAKADLSQGPLVIEVPPGSGPGLVNDGYFRHVLDMGSTGRDMGKGGKYLLLPPLTDLADKNETFEGSITVGQVDAALITDFEVVEGLQEVEVEGETLFAARSRCFSNVIGLRGFTSEDGSPVGTVDSFKRGFKVYPLSELGEPPEIQFEDISTSAINTIHASDGTFFQEVHALIQNEPMSCFGPELLGLLEAIGIEKGRPFAPSTDLQETLDQAAAVGNAAARSLTFAPRGPESYVYGPESVWYTLFPGGSYKWLTPEGARDPDSRAAFFFGATFVTPFMSQQFVGKGSQYLLAARDSEGEWLRGDRSYVLTLPPGIPAEDFWSVTVYDAQTRSLLRSPQEFPSLNSKRGGLEENPGGGFDIFFGPAPAPGAPEGNWVQTDPAGSFFLTLRLYGPGARFFDGSWRPGEPVNTTPRN